MNNLYTAGSRASRKYARMDSIEEHNRKMAAAEMGMSMEEYVAMEAEDERLMDEDCEANRAEIEAMIARDLAAL